MAENEEPLIPQIDNPLELLPDLSEWGIDEVDKGICEDTYENRRAIREFKATWRPVFNTDGSPTSYIQVITSEMKQAALVANKSVLLSDRRNPDSDYKTGMALIIEPAADLLAPAWVLAATRAFDDIQEERDRRRGTGKKLFRPSIESAPGRCVAIRIDGHRCQAWHGGRAEEGRMCRTHIANQPNREDNRPVQTVARARNKVQSAAVAAVEELESLLNATSEPVRLGAARDLLDRAGIRGGIEIDAKVEHSAADPAELVRKRLENIRAKSLERDEAQRRSERAAEADIIDVESEVVEYQAVVLRDTETEGDDDER